MTSKLTIYTASAGAGKTHTLTGEYLRLSLSSPSPAAFRRIQAVTFTNKATAEMKERILQDLHLLASAPDESPYRDLFDLSSSQLRDRACAMLRAILTDYSQMRIKTIDSFFQEILRSFARELSLDGAYRVILDTDKMLAEASAFLISDPYRISSLETINAKDKTELLQWLKQIALDLIDSGGGHNLLSEVQALGRELFREDVIDMIIKGRLPDRQALRNLQQVLRQTITAFETEALSIADAAGKIIEESGCEVEDFSYTKNGPVGRLYHFSQNKSIGEPNSYFAKVIETVGRDGDLMAMLSAKAKGNKKIAPKEEALAAAQNLFDLVSRYYELYCDESGYGDYCTAQEVIGLIGRYGIISELHRIIKDIEAENRTMLNAGSSGMVSKLMDGEDFAPILYERIGTSIDHHMIDEFQDTSRKQYDNFRPLLEQSLSNHKENLVVGDVKQSIYRFRNSDRHILSQDIAQQFDVYDPDHKNLAENWRSAPPIIDFNNLLFAPDQAHQPSALFPSIAADAMLHAAIKDIPDNSPEAAFINRLATELQESYDAPAQAVPAARISHEGAVVVHYFNEDELATEIDDIPEKPEISEQKDEPQEQHSDLILQSLVRVILDLQDRGYKPADIAILVRKTTETKAVGEELMRASASCPPNRSLRIVSAEALYVVTSPTVRFVVSAMTMISRPADPFCVGLVEAAFAQIIRESNSQQEQTVSSLFEEQIKPIIERASHLALYEMADLIIFSIQPYIDHGEQPYILAFLDVITDYCRYGQADAPGFIDYWTQVGDDKKIISPQSDDAINLMTIHKAKGLGFPVVLIPFASWRFTPLSSTSKPLILWGESGQWARQTKSKDIRQALQQVDKIPLKYNVRLKGTFFATDYFHEIAETFIDNLNTLYVAFTRAKSELHFWLRDPDSPPKDEKNITVKLDNMLYRALMAIEDRKIKVDLHKWYHYIDGEQRPSQDLPINKIRAESSTSIIKAPIQDFTSSAGRSSIKIRPVGSQTLADNTHIAHGRAMHRILEEIHQIEDLAAATQKVISEGILPADQASELLQILYNRLSNPPAVTWFDGSGTILNEATIIGGGSSDKRPDRIIIYPTDKRVVVIDYKFGSTQLSHYKAQIVRYKNLLRRMGYDQVEGYLWNPINNEILAV